VRPEDVAVVPSANGAKDLVPALVEVVEPMGAELVVYLKSASATFVARFDSHEKVKDGQELKLRFSLDKCHVFDKESEKVIV
jgi:multiple sugar transport system ATP-binding protein